MISIGDAIFYGGLLGILIGVLTILSIGRKEGYSSLTQKHYLKAGAIMMLFWLVPFWMAPMSIAVKLLGTIGAIGCGYANFLIVDRYQKRLKTKCSDKTNGQS